MRRILTIISVVIILFATFTTTALASEQWCSSDPPVRITTPSGLHVTVYATVAALGTEHLPSVEAAEISWRATSVPNGTAVSLSVTVPNDQYGNKYPTKLTINSQTPSKGGGVLLAQTSGVAGQAMVVKFIINAH